MNLFTLLFSHSFASFQFPSIMSIPVLKLLYHQYSILIRHSPEASTPSGGTSRAHFYFLCLAFASQDYFPVEIVTRRVVDIKCSSIES